MAAQTAAATVALMRQQEPQLHTSAEQRSTAVTCLLTAQLSKVKHHLLCLNTAYTELVLLAKEECHARPGL